MKKVMHFSWVFLIAAISMTSVGETTDASLLHTPQAALVALQKIIDKKDINGIKAIIARREALTRDATSYDSKLEQYAKELATYPPPWLMPGWEIIDVDYLSDTLGKPPRARVWIEIRDMKLLEWLNSQQLTFETFRCFVTFQKDGDEWKYLSPMFDGGITKKYRFSSPTNAYLAISRATRVPGATDNAIDYMTVFGAISSSLKATMELDEYKALIKRRQKSGGRDVSVLEIDRILEEPLSFDRKPLQAKVWRLDTNGVRVGFELFVKEGEEWKWIPNRKSIWHPARTEDDVPKAEP